MDAQAHEGIFGQAALLGRRREATTVARTSCEALLIAKDDLHRLFDGDAISARRMYIHATPPHEGLSHAAQCRPSPRARSQLYAYTV